MFRAQLCFEHMQANILERLVRDFVTGQYKVQTADSRFDLKSRLGTNCRLGLKCRLRLELSYRLIRDIFSIFDLRVIKLRDLGRGFLLIHPIVLPVLLFIVSKPIP